jgi:hypothetical protein
MLKLIIPFGGKELKMLVAEKMNESQKTQLRDRGGELAVALLNELSGDSRSDLTRLLDADLGFPVPINPLLWDYLTINLNLAKRSAWAFNPFNFSTDHLNYLELNSNDKTAIKKMPLRFDKAKLLNAYFLTKMTEIAKQLRVKDWCMHLHDYYLADGEKTWEVEFTHPHTGEPVQRHLSNGATVMSYQDPRRLRHQQTPAYSPFANNAEMSRVQAVIVNAGDLATAKVVGEIALTLNYPYEWKQLATNWGVHLNVIVAEGELDY